MSLVVKNNIPAVYALGTLNRNSTAMSKSLQKVSTGMKINGAADDNSAWAVSERMRVRVRGLDQADQNTQNGRSLLKVAEGAVQSTVDILKTLKEKAVNAANDSNTDADRKTIQKELNQAIDQIDDNANVTFNGKYLVDGTKNAIGRATYTALTNQSLSTDTSATTLLTDLKSRTGSNLGILTTDKVTVSYVQGGKTYTTTFDVTGSSSVATILSKAEAVDGTGYTFADRYNEAVARVNGVTNVAQLAQQANDARNFATTTGTVAANAANLNNQYNSALSTLDNTYNSFINAMGAIQHQPASNPLATGYNQLVDNARSQVNTWSGTGASGISGYADPSSLNSGYVNNLFTTWAGSLTDVGAAQTAYNAYTSAYTAMAGFLTMNPLSSVATPAAPNVSALGGSYSRTYDTSSYGAYASSAAGVHNEAVALVDSLAGPAVLSDASVGIGRDGGLVKTLDGEKGLTILAAKSGVTSQISGFTISVSDKDGNIKKSVNAYLDAFSESIRAEDESGDDALVIHVGAEPGVAIKVGLSDMRAEALGLKGSDGTKLDISTQSKANAAINVLDHAIQKALNQQVDIGSISSHLEYTAANLRVASDNVRASESAIRDADMAKEMTEYTKNNILLSASQSMFSQANQNSMDVMTLLQ